MNNRISRKSLFQNREFALLFGAQVVSLTGSGVTTIALALLAHQMVGGRSAAAVLGNALMLRILAFLIFSQPAGILADRLSRKGLLIASDLTRFFLLGVFPFVQEIWQIYLLIFLINAATSFFSPTYNALIPEVVHQDQIVKAVALSRLTLDMEAILSPLLAAVLIGLIGLQWLFWFDAATYLISAMMVVFLKSPRPKAHNEKSSLQANWVQEVTYGLRILLQEPSLRRSLILSLVAAIAGAAAIVGTVVYVRDTLQLGDNAFTAAMTFMGLGSSAMAITLGKVTGRYEALARLPEALHGRRHRWSENVMVLGGLALGAELTAMSFHPDFLLFLGLWLLSGMGQASIAIASATLLAEHTHPSNRGRTYAAHFFLTHAFWLMTYPAMGHGIEALGSVIAFGFAGILCVMLSLMVYLTRKPQHDHLHE